jgi:diguanylate cyclase (GGDEF)-like protein
MNNVLRQVGLVVQRRRFLPWLAVAGALALGWWTVTLALRVNPPATTVVGLTVLLSMLVLVLGAMAHGLANQLGASDKELARLATTDHLTGVLNRRGFIAAAGQEFARAIRYERPLALLSIDIDLFKELNGVYGHEAGDTTLQALTAAWQNLLRATDRIGRMGGEEFTILLPETDAARARELAERVRSACQGLVLPFLAHGRTVTVSVGVAAIQTGDSSIDHALARADEALLRAKRGGRNRVESAAMDARVA